MNILVVGGGGREHALVWALAASPLAGRIYCAPGNAGTAELAENVPIAATDIEGLVAFARTHDIALVVPGPEAPLVLGLADRLAEAGIRCAGPRAAAARLEGSKIFTKEIAAAAAIPTASYAAFDALAPALAHLARLTPPVVVKADGLAAGKGVVVAASREEAEGALRAFLEEGRLGAAGRRILIEECLEGEEVSVFALCDGERAVFLGAAQDHKRRDEGDRGPNTGGMGAYAPPPVFGPALAEEVMARIITPALATLARHHTPFVGILFAGLMLTREGPKLLEFNVRFGDPECQALLPRLKSDLLPGLLAACDGELGAFDLRWQDLASLAVVLAARGYPERPETGGTLEGLAAAAAQPGVLLFHGGTARREDGRIIATGGRVLTVTATAPTLAAARERAYAALGALRLEGGFYRRDIGWRALGRL